MINGDCDDDDNDSQDFISDTETENWKMVYLQNICNNSNTPTKTQCIFSHTFHLLRSLSNTYILEQIIFNLPHITCKTNRFKIDHFRS